MTSYLDLLREIGVSERLVEAERDGWILIVAAWPEDIPAVMAAKVAQLDDPQLVRLYRILSEIFENDDAGDDAPRLAEAADIMAGLAEQAYTSGATNPAEVAPDDLSIDLLDALAAESDPRTERLLGLMRERGWAGWNRIERLAEPPGYDERARGISKHSPDHSSEGAVRDLATGTRHRSRSTPEEGRQ